MIVEVKVPTPGESISEVEISSWLVADGDLVHKNQDLAEVESDKATLSITAPVSGKIQVLVESGTTVKVNSIACKIDSSVAVPDQDEDQESEAEAEKGSDNGDKQAVVSEISKEAVKTNIEDEISSSRIKATPLARNKMVAENLSVDEVLRGLKKLSSKEVDAILEMRKRGDQLGMPNLEQGSREQNRKPMSNLRKQLSRRLVQVKNETAMLTTFNEVDMSVLFKGFSSGID